MPDRRQQSCSGWGARASFFICVASRWSNPVLLHSSVGKPAESRAGRRRPVRREHRLPDGKHTDRLIRVVLQKRFDCGGPPQTGPSSRRQQNDKPCLVCVAVEFRPQPFKCCRVDRYERRLARGASPGANRYHATAAAIRTTSPATPNVRRAFFIRYGNQSANSPAITCGKTPPETTMTAERLKTIRDEYERVPHALCF